MFPVPFAFDQHPAPEPLNAALRALFLAREGEGAAFANPHPYTERNTSLFESRFDLFAWPQPEIAELREFCLSTPCSWCRSSTATRQTSCAACA